MIWHHTTDSNNVEWIYLAKTKPSIRSIAKTISQISQVMRATVRTLRESAAIEEIIQAAYEATIAARDTSIELHNVAKDLRGNQNLRKNQLIVLIALMPWSDFMIGIAFDIDVKIVT